MLWSTHPWSKSCKTRKSLFYCLYLWRWACICLLGSVNEHPQRGSLRSKILLNTPMMEPIFSKVAACRPWVFQKMSWFIWGFCKRNYITSYDFLEIGRTHILSRLPILWLLPMYFFTCFGQCAVILLFKLFCKNMVC